MSEIEMQGGSVTGIIGSLMPLIETMMNLMLTFYLIKMMMEMVGGVMR